MIFLQKAIVFYPPPQLHVEFGFRAHFWKINLFKEKTYILCTQVKFGSVLELIDLGIIISILFFKIVCSIAPATLSLTILINLEPYNDLCNLDVIVKKVF